MALSSIGVKGWRNYSTFSLFGAGSQRADRQTSMLVDTYSGNLSVLATDWVLAARIPCALSRAYNHLDTTTGVDRPFGPGWYWQFDMNLTGSMDGTGAVTWKAADGSEYEFSYSSGVWTAPAGMHQCKLTFTSGTPASYTLKIGRMVYQFEVNTDNSRARLIYIRDAFGNGLEISRTYSNSMPTATIEYISVRYNDGSSWTTHNIVEPTYTGGLITMLRLLDTASGGSYTDLHYTYTTIDSASRLTKEEPKFGATALNMEVAYDYCATAGQGLQLTKLYDSLGYQAGTQYYWTVNYSSNMVSSIVFPVDSTPTTGTVAYTYAASAPASWSHTAPSSWTKVTDALSHDWYYGHNSAGTVYYSVDPLWVNSTHESYTEYSYNADLQIVSVKTPKPNAESGQLTTSYYYNSNKNLAAVVDAYGFVSWYKYGTRASSDASGTDATVDDVIGIFSPYPNQKAYSDTDHTASETTAPSLSSPLDIDDFVDYDNNLADNWAYLDGDSNPVALVRSVMYYSYTDSTGRLTQLLSCSPENFAEASATSYTLTSASACSKQQFNANTGDLSTAYTPSQFKDANLYYTAYTYDATYGVVTEFEAADSLKAGVGKKTLYTYNATKTRVTKVQQPQDNANQWQETVYDSRLFATGVKRPDIASWGAAPIVSVSVYDNNGQLYQSWQANPDYTSSPRWDGDTAHGYDKVRELSYDRLGRVIQSDSFVDWNQDSTVETLSTYFTYDLNGNQTRVKGPAYVENSTTYYTYNFTSYDTANRAEYSYLPVANTSTDLASPPSGTKFTQYIYDIAGNAMQVRDPLYNGLSSTTLHVTTTTFDWHNRGIATSRVYTGTSGEVTVTTQQHFTASGGAYWSADAEGYKMYPEQDKDGRLLKLHRGSFGGASDERTYDYDGRALYQYSYADVAGGKVKRNRSKYDEMGRAVNSGREEYSGGSWINWNANTADAAFNYNSAPLRSYDKVNSGVYSAREYDNWGRTTTGAAPVVQNVYKTGAGITITPLPTNATVPDPDNVIYNANSGYDVLSRQISSTNRMYATTDFSFDLLGRTVLVSDPLNYDTITYFDARGLKAEVHTSGGAVHKYFYDGRGLLTLHRVTHDSQDDDTVYTYNDLGQLTQVEQPDGGITMYEYDEIGRRTKVSVLLSGSDYLDTTYTYDANGRMLTMTQPGGLATTFVYDDLGNMTSMTDPQGLTTSYTYDADNRRLTVTQPNGTTQGLVTTYSYDWKTGQVASIIYERDTTPANDITVSYSYDDNGRVTGITDGRGNVWSKTYDAMGRMLTLTTPSGGSGSYTHTIWYDGNGNMLKTRDFKSTDHYYKYDVLNRMTGNGADINAYDETYTYACCSRLSAYTDALGTASLSYDGLSRLTAFSDSNGNNVSYAYDTMGRITTLTPAQGTNYRTEYAYNANGSVATVTVYDAGTAAVTSYAYNATTGRLTSRNFPEASGQYVKTAYSYDAYGRLEYETVTRETGSTTNLYRTQYAYSRIAFGIQLERTEQAYSGGAWANANKTQYQWDTLGRQAYEQRYDWDNGAWSTRYDITQVYDQNGNRTGYDKNVAAGYTADYGKAYNLSYTFDSLNQLTAIMDSDDLYYSCSVTSDANMNITLLEEKDTRRGGATLYSYFEYDALNRMTAHKTKANLIAGSSQWWWTKRAHQYDAVGRLVRSTWKTWPDGQSEPGGNSLEHVYAGAKHVQNYDGTNYGRVWHWAGAQNEHMGPLASPNADTASQQGYNLANGGADVAGGAGGPACGAGGMSPQKRTFLSPTTEGDQRHLFGQGRPMAKDSSGSGSAWATGTVSRYTGASGYNVESRLMFEGTVAATDMSRATDAREKDRIGIFGTGLSYAGSYGRVTSESIGRDLNPLGRGAGQALMGGELEFGVILPSSPKRETYYGVGNSVNNNCPHCHRLELAKETVTSPPAELKPAPQDDEDQYWESTHLPRKPFNYDPWQCTFADLVSWLICRMQASHKRIVANNESRFRFAAKVNALSAWFTTALAAAFSAQGLALYYWPYVLSGIVSGGIIGGATGYIMCMVRCLERGNDPAKCASNCADYAVGFAYSSGLFLAVSAVTIPYTFGAFMTCMVFARYWQAHEKMYRDFCEHDREYRITVNKCNLEHPHCGGQFYTRLPKCDAQHPDNFPSNLSNCLSRSGCGFTSDLLSTFGSPISDIFKKLTGNTTDDSLPEYVI